MSATQPDGYFAMPTAGKGSPVLVLHPWWGLNDTIKALCKRLAESGFVAFAPDLYHGKIATTIPEAETLSSALSQKFEQAKAEVVEAAEFLKKSTGSDTIAVIGFSMGAFYALDFSANGSGDARSVVIFYGAGPGDFGKSKADYLGHFAADDPYEPAEGVQELEADIKSAGREVTFHTYPGTGHWFFEPDRADAYNEAAANLAWERTLAFLKR